MPEDGHLVWKTPASARKFSAIGYSGGKKAAEDIWPETISGTSVSISKTALRNDGQDVAVLDIISEEERLPVRVENAELLGWGNGDPGFKEVERPRPGDDGDFFIRPFSGRAQVLVRSLQGSSGTATVYVGTQRLTLEIR